jgi:hypothetical protein
LNEEGEKAKVTLRELSKLYTEPSEDPDQPALHRYTLRGISTSKSTTYISTQAEPDLIDMDLNKDEANLDSDQWWRIVYPASGSTPFSVEVRSPLRYWSQPCESYFDNPPQKTTLEEALEAAKCFDSQDGSVLLVYASEKAMSWERKPLPKALEVGTLFDTAYALLTCVRLLSGMTTPCSGLSSRAMSPRLPSLPANVSLIHRLRILPSLDDGAAQGAREERTE